jgi:AAA family ATP:ADP antiporter
MDATVNRIPATADGGRRGPLDRVLNIFTDVRGGEGLTALLLLLNVFLLLASYYLIKTIREPLVLAAEGGGAEVKSYSSAAIAGLLIVLVPLYSAIASRVSRVRLINGVTLFFIACLVGFFFWARAVYPPGTLALGVTFFIWVGIFNLMIIAQFWAFANDFYTVEQGKRLFAIVAFGASLGAIAGSKVAEILSDSVDIYAIMGIAAAILVLCMVLTNVVHARERDRARAVAREKQAGGEATADADALIKGKSGFSLVFSDRYLLLIAMLMLILNLVNTTGEYILGETLTNIAKDRVAQGLMTGEDIGKWIGSFYGNYFFWVNTVSAIIQAFFVSRIIKWFGVRGALLVLPVVALGAYAILVAAPVLAIIRGAKIAENSLDYSLNNTTRQTLFLPTSREAKYKGKQAIDTFFVRLGDVASAGLVFAGTTWLAFAPKQFAMVNVGLVLVWLFIAFSLGRMFRERSGGEA